MKVKRFIFLALHPASSPVAHIRLLDKENDISLLPFALRKSLARSNVCTDCTTKKIRFFFFFQEVQYVSVRFQGTIT